MNRIVSFTCVKALALQSPPTHPPPTPPAAMTRLGYGDYCWRATCEAFDTASGNRVATLTGYSPHLDGICDETLETCERRFAGEVHTKIGCEQPQLVLLAASRKECSGIFMLDYRDGSTKKLV